MIMVLLLYRALEWDVLKQNCVSELIKKFV